MLPMICILYELKLVVPTTPPHSHKHSTVSIKIVVGQSALYTAGNDADGLQPCVY